MIFSISVTASLWTHKMQLLCPTIALFFKVEHLKIKAAPDIFATRD